ncbi:hypothetical protein [Mucilaginibacter pedocola]|uniref:hypothetical protein n=1 Tax=Mucilaginibacter pedocola TaxID=1792845 RepID=UPI00117CD62C|nr:hypothetical protein [Mucilaginibacter pedocola]
MKFFYLYLIGGIVALALLVYQLIVTYPDVRYNGVLVYATATGVLFYMANKAYHVKKDKELM